MNLPIRQLTLKPVAVRGQTVLAVDTGFAPDSLEGLRLVKASRGQGWVWAGGRLAAWSTKGVQQEDRRLLVWGECEAIPAGGAPEAWPLEGPEARDFLTAFVKAWTARASAEPLPVFSPSAVLPWKTPEGWTFVFPPADLRGVLDSLLPLSERLAWEHLRHPELAGGASWAFASAALAIRIASGTLPWEQADEEHLRQELRELKRTFAADELPEGPEPATLALWHDSVTGRLGAHPDQRWKTWASAPAVWNSAAADPARSQKRSAARQRRDRRRSAGAFWRRRGTLVTALTLGILGLAAVVGSVVWGAVKPDPTDRWTAAEVVAGYYAAIDDQDAETMRKITKFNKDQEIQLARDAEEATNLFVIRQVRTAYERKSPVLKASEWEAAGKPALETGQMLYGLAGLTTAEQGGVWTVQYRKWVVEGDDTTGQQPSGVQVTDRLTLVSTDRGPKISSLSRDRQPLP